MKRANLKQWEANATRHSSMEKAERQQRLQERTQLSHNHTHPPKNYSQVAPGLVEVKKGLDEGWWLMRTCSLTHLSARAPAELWLRGIPRAGQASAARALSQKGRAPDNLHPAWRGCQDPGHSPQGLEEPLGSQNSLQLARLLSQRQICHSLLLYY